MVRATVIPDNQNVTIHIPKEYAGRQIEVLLYATDEPNAEAIQKTGKQKPSDFAVTLSAQDAVKLLKDIKQSRNEWEKDI